MRCAMEGAGQGVEEDPLQHKGFLWVSGPPGIAAVAQVTGG